MTSIRLGLRRFRAKRLGDDVGATAVEYGLILAGVGILSVVSMSVLNSSLKSNYTDTMPQNGVTVCADAACTGVDPLAGVANGIPDATGLSAPVLTGIAGNGQVTLSWTEPANTGTAIIGYTATGKPSGTCAVTVTSCTITGLLNSKQYLFTVAARNSTGTGTGPSSNTVALTPSVPTAPDPPIDVTGVAGNGLVTVSWTAPSNTGGSGLTAYAVTASPDGLTCAVAPPTTTCDVTLLSNGTAYTFTVRATNSSGLTSDPSLPSAAVTPVGPPDAPTAVSGTAGDSKVTVSWTAPTVDGGSPLTSYTVTTYAGGAPILTTTTPTAVTTFDVTGLTNGTAYTFTVAATNSAGLSGPPSSPSTSTTPAGSPGAPTAVSGTAGDSKVTVSWTAPTSNGGSPIASYTVTAFAGGSTISTTTTPTAATTFDVTGLTNGTAYTFTVTATNAKGKTSAESLPSVSVVPSKGLPDAPTGLTAQSGTGQVALAWTAPNPGRSAISDYVVQYRRHSSLEWLTFSHALPIVAPSATVTGLVPGITYDFQVSAVNSAGTGPPSASASAAAKGTCTALQAITVSGLNPPTGTSGKLNVAVLPTDLVGGKVQAVAKNTSDSSSDSGNASVASPKSGSVLWYSVTIGGDSTNRRWVGTISYSATNCSGTATGTSLTLTK
jgi:predicted phage tail protein/Flp pilus assembly pilin Flp